MSALPAISTPYIHSSIKRRKNTWYSIADGNWSDRNIWMSNSLRKYNYPQAGDDVYINHTVKGDTTTTINNLRIAGKLTFSNSVSISVTGDIQATGTVDMTGSSTGLILYGVNNFIVTFTSGTSSTVTYAKTFGEQPVMNIAYRNLSTNGFGTRIMVSNISVAGNLSIAAGSTSIADSVVFEAGAYNLTVTGTTTISNGAAFSKNGTGSLLFIGAFSDAGFLTHASFTGNPNIEFRGGISIYNNSVDFGAGTVTFTTNSQTITQINSGISKFTTPSIVGAITLTVGVGSGAFQVTSIDGTVSGSALINKGILYIASSTMPMPTNGTWDYTTYSTNTIGFVVNGNFTIPYTTFTGSVLISGTGTKSLSGATTIGGDFTLSNVIAAATFDPAYNISVTGSTIINNSIFKCTTASLSFLFVGMMGTGGGGGSTIDFSSGNPSVELRNGLGAITSFTSGSGTWSFTTNNQTLNLGNSVMSFDCSILIAGITVTLSSSIIETFNGVINGSNSSSILDNRSTLNYTNATAPMITGKLYCNQAANTFTYGASGNQDIQVPSDPTPGYKNLTLSGSGAKKLLGNVSVKGVYTLTAPATLDTNGFSLTNP